MPTTPYDNLETVINLARMKLNDMIVSTGGDIVTDNAVFTPTIIQSGWRKFQGFLSKLGFSKFTEEIAVLSQLPPVSSIDPAVLCWLDWTGYSNGATLFPAFVLPQDAIMPKMNGLEERISQMPGQPPLSFLEMDDLTGRKLPLVQKAQWIKMWEWRDEKIWFPGSKTLMDLRVRYDSFLADFVAASVTPFASQIVPIMRSAVPFACYIAFEVAVARGDLDAKGLIQEAEEQATVMVARENPAIAQAASQPAPAPQVAA